MTEAELLFSELLNCGRADLYLNRAMPLDKDKLFFISSVLKRRIQGEPIQYILGKTEFMGLEFKVNPSVLIPRHETEILVETAVKYSSQSTAHGLQLKILDMGTGSGCIAIALAKLLPDCQVTGADISAEALRTAAENVNLYNLNEKIKLIQGDLFLAISRQLPAFGLIVSNPPYIPTQGIEHLQSEIQYEPRTALDGGKDGLDFYRRIIKGSGFFLKQGGFLILEIGFGQIEKIKNIFQKFKNFEIIEVVKDYSGIDRVVAARKNNFSFQLCAFRN